MTLFVRAIPVLLVLSICSTSQGQQAAPAPPGGPPPGTPTPRQVMESVRARLDEGTLDVESGHQALTVLEAILEREPRNAEANLLAGEILMLGRQRADYDQARLHFQRVLDSEPSNFRANLGTGRIWIASRYWRQAASFLETAERVAPREKSAEVKQLLASAYLGMGDPDRAVAKAQEALEVDPKNLDALETVVQIRLQVAERDPRQLEPTLASAENFVRLAAEKVEQEPWNSDHLARLDGAYSLELRALQSYHNSLYQRDIHRAVTDRLESGQETEAAATLLRIAARIRLQAALQQALAEHDARMMIERAAEYEPDNLRNLEALAGACERTRDVDAAIAAYRRILELEPEHEGALRQLEALGVSVTSTTGAESADGQQ